MYNEIETLTLHVCPNGCATTFETSAHVMQFWRVDASGIFIEEINHHAQVSHGPDNDNSWTCMECGAEATMVQCNRVHIKVGDTNYLISFPTSGGSVVYWERFGAPEIHTATVQTAADGTEYIDAAGMLIPIERP